MGHKGRIIAPITEAVGGLLSKSSQICDPFCGSASVSWHFASTFNNKVWASDLQSYAAARAAAVLARTEIPTKRVLELWIEKSVAIVNRSIVRMNGASVQLPMSWSMRLASSVVNEHRQTSEQFCLSRVDGILPLITGAYGGHYFSMPQAVLLDALRTNLPKGSSARLVAICSLIGAASKCCASPGHTAQPFQPTKGAAKWLLDAWRRDPLRYLRDEWDSVINLKAMKLGRVMVGDAEITVRQLNKGDVVFLDPPYSDVHYSRFYHVLETLTRGRPVSVSGKGRYPPPEQRPTSSFSRRSEALEAFERILMLASKTGLRVAITFPFDLQSNGLSADLVSDLCRNVFSRVVIAEASSVFSTLGGTGRIRSARVNQREAIISAYN